MVKVNLPNITYKYYEIALIYVIRGRDRRVIDRSLQKFSTRSEFRRFREVTSRKYPDLEVHEFHLRQSFSPIGTPERAAHLWCPYCCSWRKYVTSQGYTICEICQMSTKDFYFIKYNPKYREKGTRKTSKSKAPAPRNNPSSDDDKREKARLRRERRKARKLKEGKS